MFILVYGGSASGKSGIAEEMLLKSEEKEKYYIATMRPDDEESVRRIEKHRRARSKKGFITIEQHIDVQNAAALMRDDVSKGALLECVTNLVANEMFGNGGFVSDRDVAEKIEKDIGMLIERTELFVAVTGNVFQAGTDYEGYTRSYLDALGEINQRLAARADKLCEVVCGIPIEKGLQCIF